MGLLDLLSRKGSPDAGLPPFVRQVEEVAGVRILRLQGNVGRSIGGQTEDMTQGGESAGEFERSLLLDFKGTTGSDFSTVSFLVNALRKRMHASARVGIINPTPQLLAELEIARLARYFECFGTEQEAIERLSVTEPEDA